MANKRSAPKPTSAPSRLPWILGAVLVVAAVAAGALWLGDEPAAATPLRTVGVDELAAAVDDGATLIDVREAYEYDAGHVEGAQLMPLADTVRLASGLPKDEPVYVICRSGNRSLVAAEALVDAGFEDVRNVDGGMIAWQSSGRPVAR